VVGLATLWGAEGLLSEKGFTKKIEKKKVGDHSYGGDN